MAVRIIISDPAHHCLELNGSIWFGSGLHRQAENLLRT